MSRHFHIFSFYVNWVITKRENHHKRVNQIAQYITVGATSKFLNLAESRSEDITLYVLVKQIKMYTFLGSYSDLRF